MKENVSGCFFSEHSVFNFAQNYTKQEKTLGELGGCRMGPQDTGNRP